MEAAHLPNLAALRIVQAGRNVWRDGSSVDSGVLVDAADYYRAFYRSARTAERYILMSGWQFDSGVELLRGDDAAGQGEVRFLKFLNGLCEQKPNLCVYILAWDFNLVLAGEREWMQRVLFHWMTHPHFNFLPDDAPVSGGSHHQKFVVMDGTHAFLGGMDVCESRWDDRRHCGTNPLRISRGARSKPYHDVQAYVAGSDATAPLEALFRARWERAGGPPLTLPSGDVAPSPPRPQGLLGFGPARVGYSRTQPAADDAQTVREVEHLFVDAIAAAEQLIYIETQYFSSRRLADALEARMRRADRARLEIVIVVNERAEALKEELAVGLRQAENLRRLRQLAAETGHALGLYFPVCDGVTKQFRATYIHSKVLLIDDRFLTVGSANFTNRSMGTDSELHVSWETQPGDADEHRLTRAIRRVRVSLLAEHAGLAGVAAVSRLVAIDGLVSRLDAIAGPFARLQRHGPPSPGQQTAMEIVDPKNLPFDPDTSPPGELSADEEPVEEASQRLLASLPRAIARFTRSLGRRPAAVRNRRQAAG